MTLRTLRTLGWLLFDDRIGLRVAPYLQLNVFPLDLIVQYLRAPGTFTFFNVGKSQHWNHLHIMRVSCASLTFLHVISCCIMQAYTGWQQLSCVIGAKTPVMLVIITPPIWIIAILLPIPRDKWTCWSWEPTGSDLGRKDSADLVSRRQWFSPTNISPHVHLQQKSGAKVKHFESSHELTAETLKLFGMMLLMGGDILVTWWCFAAINISFYLAQVLLRHCYNFITQLLFLLWIWNETMR